MFFNLFVRVCARERTFYSRCVRSCRFHKDVGDSTPNVPISHIKQSFKQRCLAVTEGHTCVVADCPICNGKKKGSKVYINKTTGFFICDTCKCNGTWDTLDKFLVARNSSNVVADVDMLKADIRIDDNYKERWEQIQRTCQNIADLPLEEFNNVLDMFSFARVAQQDIDQLNCRYDGTSSKLYFPLTSVNNSIVGYKVIATEPEKEETVPITDVSGCIIYRERDVTSDGTAVIVGTIHDLLALVSQRSANVVICLPYSLQHLPQQLLPCLEEYKKLVLWFGNDETSWNTARHFAKKLSEKRCHFVRPTDLQPQPKLAVDMGYDLQSILENAQSVWHKSITTFQHLREDVLSDLQNNDKVQGVKWKRYPSLNRILKGHRRGEFTVLTGPTGCGKTTFMSEYSLDLALQGVNTLWGSFEIRNVRLARTMLQQMSGVPLEKNIENFDLFADRFQKLPVYFMTFHGQQSIKVVMDAVEHATYVHDIAHVIIDNIQFMMGTSDEAKHLDRFWKQDNIVSKFRNFATKYNCHVTAIIHPRKQRDEEELTTSSIFGSAKATQEADNVLIIQDKRLNSIRGKKYLQVAKNRHSGDLGIMVMDFDKDSLSYAQKKKPKAESSKHETSNAKEKSSHRKEIVDDCS